jgi:DNA adenine methylase
MKCHGGKSYLAARIVTLLPPHETYVEPYAGGAAVLLRKPPARREILGDIDTELMNMYRVVQDQPDALLKKLAAIDYCEASFDWAAVPVSDSPIDRAVASFVRNRMSRGGLGKDFAWSERQRGGRPGDQNAWLTWLTAFPAIAARLHRVELVCGDGLELIRQHDRPGTLFYLDPPYLPATRTARRVYRHEMTTDDHERLLDALVRLRHAAVVLSGYYNNLYDSALAGWRRVEWNLPNHAGQGKTKGRRIECVWIGPG